MITFDPPEGMAVNCWVAPAANAAIPGVTDTVTGDRVTVALPAAEGLPIVEAVIVSVFFEGMLLGAVYRPLTETVPTVAFPPCTPLTAHVSCGFEPGALAENCCV